jgi:ATP-dependent helicase YprA (DUF1998 family)
MTATCALELGIDIGGLDAVLMLGYPNSMASLMQETGRAGRSGRDGLSFLVCFDSPLDQYLARHPEALFSKSVEASDIDVANSAVLSMHAMCAATELPLYAPARGAEVPQTDCVDGDFFGPGLIDVVETLHSQDRLVPSSCGPSYWQPAHQNVMDRYQIDLRNIEQAHYRVLMEPSMTEIDTIVASEVRIQCSICADLTFHRHSSRSTREPFICFRLGRRSFG